MKPAWLDFVDTRRRTSLLAILAELSMLQRKENLNFIIIGALPLLISSYLRYTALWDIDLLFNGEAEIEEFAMRSKSKALRIVDYDETMMVSENITSFHSAWTFDKNWFNVDYILVNKLFEFYTLGISQTPPFQSAINWNRTDYQISLYLAHPWDIIVNKIISPRTQRDITLRVDTSIDIRHVFAVYRTEKDNKEFWRHITARAQFFCSPQQFKKKFLGLLEEAPALGYDDIEISTTAKRALESS